MYSGVSPGPAALLGPAGDLATSDVLLGPVEGGGGAEGAGDGAEPLGVLRSILLAIRSAKASVLSVLGVAFAASVRAAWGEHAAESRRADRENRMHDSEQNPQRVKFMASARFLGSSELNTSTHAGLLWALTKLGEHAVVGHSVAHRYNFILTDCAIYRFYSRLQYAAAVDQKLLRSFYGGFEQLPGVGLHPIQKLAKLGWPVHSFFLREIVPDFLSARLTGAPLTP